MGLALLLLYIGLLGLGTVITPGVGFFGGIIAMLPQWVTESSHVPAYGLLTWLFASGLQRRGWPRTYRVLVAAAGAMVFGIWMEILQGTVPGRVVSIDDVIVNGAGIGMAVALMLWTSMPIRRIDRPAAGHLCVPGA